MKFSATITAMICLALSAQVYAQDAAPAPAGASEFHATNEFSVVSNELNGPGKSASSLTKGLNYLEVLNLYGSGVKGAWTYNYTAGGKATDDLRNDSKKLSLTNIQGRATDNVHTVTVGDVFESFSQYALATSLKGASYRFLKEGTKLPEVTGVFGWAYHSAIGWGQDVAIPETLTFVPGAIWFAIIGHWMLSLNRSNKCIGK